jgi:hypothetical protein
MYCTALSINVKVTTWYNLIMNKLDELIKKLQYFKEELKKNTNQSYGEAPANGADAPMAMSEKCSFAKNGQWSLDKAETKPKKKLPGAGPTIDPQDHPPVLSEKDAIRMVKQEVDRKVNPNNPYNEQPKSRKGEQGRNDRNDKEPELASPEKSNAKRDQSKD